MDATESFPERDRAALAAEAHNLRERAHALAAEALLARTASSAKRSAAEAAVVESNRLLDLLRVTVTEHAKLVRALGAQPEQAVRIVAEVVHEASATARLTAAHFDPSRAQTLRDHLVRWTIDGYYSAAS